MDFPRGVDVLHGRGHLKRKSSLKQLRIQKRLKFQVDDVIRPSLLTVRDFTKDCLCLASIMRIYKNRLRLSLPHHQFAYAYVQEATSLFRVGQYVSCAISKPAKGNRRTKWHQVSIFPRDVNRFVGRVQPGTVFSGVVTALEDHGFTVDLGINEYVGFLNKKRSIKEFGRLLSIGSYVLGVTTNVVGRVVTLQSPSVALNATLNGEDGVFVQSITPGSRLHLNRNEFKTLKDGLYYSRDGLNVFVNRLDMPDFTSEIPDEGTIVTVVYVNESTKTIYASLLHSHFLLQSSTFNDDHSKWKRGVFISKSVVEHLKKAYCILKTRDGTRCYLRINNTDTKQKNNVDRMADLMKVGDCKQCRVIDVNGFEGFLIVSTIPRDLNRNEPFSIGDLKVGQKVNVKSIKSQGKNGWTVGISRSVTGFVPKAHTNADALKLLKTGRSCIMRILNLRTGSSESIDKLVLTANPQMIKATKVRKLLHDWKSGGPITVPVIVSHTLAENRGALVASFGEIRGRLLPYPGEIYETGQFVYCERQPTVSLIEQDVLFKLCADPRFGNKPEPEFGKVHENAKVIRVEEECIYLETQEGDLLKCPTDSVFDFKELNDELNLRNLEKILPIESRVKCVCLGSDFEKNGIGCLRPIVIDFFSNTPPQDNITCCCVIERIDQMGLEVRVLIKGIPIGFIHHSHVDWSYVSEGQTIPASISQGQEDKRLLLSMRDNSEFYLTKERALDEYLEQLNKLTGCPKVELFKKEIKVNEIKGKFNCPSDCEVVVPVHFDEQKCLHCIGVRQDRQCVFRHQRFSIVHMGKGKYAYILPEVNFKHHLVPVQDMRHQIFTDSRIDDHWTVGSRETVDGFNFLTMTRKQETSRVLYSELLLRKKKFPVTLLSDSICIPKHLNKSIMSIKAMAKTAAVVVSVKPKRGLTVYLSSVQIGHIPLNHCCRTFKEVEEIEQRFKVGYVMWVWTLNIENYNVMCTGFDPNLAYGEVKLARVVPGFSSLGKRLFMAPFCGKLVRAHYPPTEASQTSDAYRHLEGYIEVLRCYKTKKHGWVASCRPESLHYWYFVKEAKGGSVRLVNGRDFCECVLEVGMDARWLFHNYELVKCDKWWDGTLTIDLKEYLVRQACRCEDEPLRSRLMADPDILRYAEERLVRFSNKDFVSTEEVPKVIVNESVKEDEDLWFRKSEEVENEKTIVTKEQDIMVHEVEKSSVFQQMVALDPDNVFNWVRLIACEVEKGNVESARLTAKRALQAFRNDSDKLAIWLSLLNVEIRFGSEVWSVFDEALKNVVDHKELYRKVIGLLASADRLDEAKTGVERMVKSFPDDKDILLDCLNFFFSSKMLEEGRSFLDRTLNCPTILKPSDQVDLICRCAFLEFQHGDGNQGKVLFEKLISTYPKRLDVWSVYISGLLKKGESRAGRIVFDRLMELKPMKEKKLEGIKKQFSEAFQL